MGKITDILETEIRPEVDEIKSIASVISTSIGNDPSCLDKNSIARVFEHISKRLEHVECLTDTVIESYYSEKRGK